MRQEEENQLREENRALREQVSLQQTQIGLLQGKDRVQEEVIRALQQHLSVQEQEMSLLRQQDLRKVSSQQTERRQVVDLPPKRLVITEHQAEAKICPGCQQVTQADFPQEVRASVQYGPAFGAVAVYLVQQQLVPYERACEVMQDLLGPTMSVGTLQALVQRCAERLEPVEQQLKAALSQVEVLHQDETGLYVAGRRHWMHVSATKHLTHYQVHTKRGHEALDEIGILNHFHGVSVHDGWQSYWRYSCQHALCNVHHLRELVFLYEVQGHAWAGHMIELLLDMKAAVEQARTDGRTSLHPLEVADWKVRYRALLQDGYQANPPDPPPQVSRRGRRTQSPARNLLDRLSTHQEAVLAFLDNFAVPFDNSQAERDIRMVSRPTKDLGLFPFGCWRAGLLPHTQLSVYFTQARSTTPLRFATGFGRPPCFPCFLALVYSHRNSLYWSSRRSKQSHCTEDCGRIEADTSHEIIRSFPVYSIIYSIENLKRTDIKGI